MAERNPKDIFSRSASIAEDMKKLALATLQVWITQFGSMYKELDVAVEYLKLNEQSMESLREEIHCKYLKKNYLEFFFFLLIRIFLNF